MTHNPRKKLFFLFDGTANSAAAGHWTDATNVFRMNLALHYDDNQIVFYIPGVGTRGDTLAQATGRGMDEILREAYVTLASNFLPGDAVYFFGFSRGSATAFALADLISKVGLLSGDHLHALAIVWQVYIGRDEKGVISDRRRRELWDTHLKAGMRNEAEVPRISFLGLLDPVPGNRWDTLTHFTKSRLQDPVLPKAVDSAISLLAIDDNRVPSFAPLVISCRDNNAQHLRVGFEINS
jgi:uncharacterized protein (DUF2235 family)